MPKERKGWTLRSPRKFSNYVKRCMRRASLRRFTRTADRAEEGSRQREEAMRFGRRAAEANKDPNRLPRLERDVVVNCVADMGLKTSKAKHQFSAKEYARLLDASRKYVRAGMGGHEKARDRHLEEIGRICGPERGETVIREIENARAIVAGWV